MSREELEAAGWELSQSLTDVHLVFRKGDEIVSWNKDTGRIERKRTCV